MNASMIATTHKINTLFILGKLSNIEVYNLTDIEMSIYALRGLAGARGINDITLLEGGDILLGMFDMIKDYVYKGDEDDAKEVIEMFKDFVETLKL